MTTTEQTAQVTAPQDLRGRDLLPYVDLRRLYPDMTGNPVFIHCPFHGDAGKPNYAVNRNFCYCFVCRRTETALAHVRRTKKLGAGAAWEYMAHNLTTDKPQALVEDTAPPLYNSTALLYQKNLTDEGTAYLQRRYGLRPQTIQRATLGYFKGSWPAYTIPIYGLDGTLRNIRFRADHEAKPDIPFRYWGVKGHNAPQWYLPLLSWQKKGATSPTIPALVEGLTKKREVYLTEGELDALVACQEGIPAISITDGAEALRGKWDFSLGALQGLDVYVAYDQDKAGQDAARAIVGKLLDAGVWAASLTWDATLGKDASELVAAGVNLKLEWELARPAF
jgi:DNA primase